jgi:sugar lactone lactonase YvrE
MKSVQVAFAGRAELAEGPTWYKDALWWVNIVEGTLNRWDPRTGLNSSRATAGFLGAAAPCSDGRWIIARKQDCALLDWETGAITPFSSTPHGLQTEHRFNDGKVGPAGNFWVGTLSLKQRPHEASLYVLNDAGEFHRARTGLTLANGLAWSADGRRFYHVDTPTKRVQAFDFQPDSSRLSNESTLIHFSDTNGFPDGMTCDEEGHLWIALWGAGEIVRVDGGSGKIIECHHLPVTQVSSCTFGGPNLSTLFITTAWENFTLDQRQTQPLAGSIFALETTTRGLPTRVFRLK